LLTVGTHPKEVTSNAPLTQGSFFFALK
jgi:hypothetical protein